MMNILLILLLIPLSVHAFAVSNGGMSFQQRKEAYQSLPSQQVLAQKRTILRSSFSDPPDPSEIPKNGKGSNNEADDIDFESDIDWDAEWKKVTSGKQKSIQRPSGRAKTDIELAAVRAKKLAEAKLYQAQGEAKKIKYKTNWNSLKGDWKFWVGVLALLSIATSVLTAQGLQSSNLDNFYV